MDHVSDVTREVSTLTQTLAFLITRTGQGGDEAGMAGKPAVARGVQVTGQDGGGQGVFRPVSMLLGRNAMAIKPRKTLVESKGQRQELGPLRDRYKEYTCMMAPVHI